MNEKICSDSLLIISENSAKVFSLNGNANVLNKFFKEFFRIIAIHVEDHKVTIESPFIKVTEEIKKQIADLITNWKNSDVKFFQLKKFFDVIPTDNYISLLPSNSINQVLYVYLLSSIRKLNVGCSLEDVLANTTDIQNFESLFSELLSKYSTECNISSVGEVDKAKRICRFCGKSIPDVSFNKIAHAIPEGLGNKAIIDNEECDDCNHRFGNGLDNELIDYFSFHRGIFGIRGKNGIVKNKFENGYITQDENGIVIASQNINIGADGKPESVEFVSEKKLMLQNIYKALARISIGTIKNFDKDIFNETIKWISHSDFYYEFLPKIAVMCSPDMYTEQPDIINYTLKTEEDLPFLVSELHLKFLVIVYIVPVKENDFSFTDNQKYDAFWKTFRHYAVSNCWRFMDFSSKDAMNIKYSLKFKEFKDM